MELIRLWCQNHEHSWPERYEGMIVSFTKCMLWRQDQLQQIVFVRQLDKLNFKQLVAVLQKQSLQTPYNCNCTPFSSVDAPLLFFKPEI
jgi:hypothetical protein